MVEPYHFPCRGMLRHRLTRLPGSQAFPSPFGFNARFTAICFDSRLILGLKHGLPRERKTGAEVPDQHPAFFNETPPDLRINALEDFAAVSNWRLTALGRWFQAKEEDLQRPGVSIRMLVVEKYALVGRVVSGGIDIIFDPRAWKKALGMVTARLSRRWRIARIHLEMKC